MKPPAGKGRVYMAYCKANQVSDPEVMMALDRRRWGGHVGYVLWVATRQMEYFLKFPAEVAFNWIHHPEAWRRWVDWLEKNV